MPEIIATSDVNLVLLKKADLFKTVIPSKIFEAMAMERPLILGVEGESKAIIEEAAGFGHAGQADVVLAPRTIQGDHHSA